MTCLICRDPEKPEPLLERKICPCNEPLFHESCLTKWIRTTPVPQCPHCKAALDVEYERSASARIRLVEFVRAFYRSGWAPFLFPFLISVVLLSVVLITGHPLAKLLAVPFLLCNFFLNAALRLRRPGGERIAFVGDAFNATSMIAVIVSSLPRNFASFKTSWGGISLASVALVWMWYLAYRETNAALRLLREKRSKGYRKLK